MEIKIFIASSEELKQERLELADIVEHLNNSLARRDIKIQLVKWEYLDSSMGPKHKQEEYNEALRQCEMCLVLYWTRFGMYTKTELDTAYHELCAGRNPQKLYVYFKDGEDITPELKTFRDSFPKQYGHFYNHFANIDTLKTDFILQFIDYQSKRLESMSLVEVRNSQVTIDGNVLVDLKNVPFAGNNEEYNLLQKNIKKTKKLLAITEPDDPDYAEYASELQEMQEKLSKMESSLWDTALMITKLSTTKCSERLQRAMDLFSAGDNKGAQAILNEEEINKDITHNLNLIKLGKEGLKALLTNIEEYRLKIKTLRNELGNGWLDEVERLYKFLIDITANDIDDNIHFETLNDYSCLLKEVRRYSDSIAILKQMERIAKDQYIYDVYMRLGEAYCWTKDFAESEHYYDKALSLVANDTKKKIKYLVLKANVYYTIDKDKTADMYIEALELWKVLIATNEDYNNDLEYAEALNNLANVRTSQKRFEEAKDLHLHALSIRRKYCQIDKTMGESFSSYSLKNLGDMYLEMGKLAEAQKAYQEAVTIRKVLAAKNPYVHNSHLSMCLNGLGRVLVAQHKPNEAEEILNDALKLRRSLAEMDRKVYINHVARTLDNLGENYISEKRFEEAEKVLQESYHIRLELHNSAPTPFSRDELENCLDLVIANYEKWDKPDYAEKYKKQRSSL